jgi:hypothetical protein
MDNSLIQDVSILTLLMKEGKINSAQFAHLERLLKTNKLARQYYVMLVNNDLILKNSDILSSPNTRPQFDLLVELGEYEKTAPKIEFPKQDPQRELIQKVVYPSRGKRKIDKSSIAFVMMNIAAMFFVILFLKLAPPKGGNRVATLTDSINAKLTSKEGKLINGMALVASDKSLLLSEGYAEILFDNQAKVTIEGPAEFKILAEDQIKLTYGRLYAAVPREAIGFTVKTPSVQIVDLGTEFGVDCSLHSDTSLHVIKGKTVLIAGDKSNKESIEVNEGVAKKVLAATQTVSSIPCNDRLFVRMIDSANDLIWRGETEMSLADIVANGNGFGTGLSESRGNCKKNPAGIYVPINSNNYIDGVFVPTWKEGAPEISSTGLVFHECPETSGEHLLDFSYANAPFGIRTTESVDGMSNEPSLLMHANAGITFDLGPLRANYPDFLITGFTSQFGIKDDPELVDISKADLWILVDGQLVYNVKGAIQGQGYDIHVPLDRSSQYLTLVVTESADGKDMNAWFNRYILGDWCVFGNPILNFIEVDNDQSR